MLSAEAPKIVIGPEVISQTESGNTIVLTCIVYSDLTPTVIWHHGNYKLENGSRYTIYEKVVSKIGVDFVMSVLEICNTEEDDSGLYSCTAHSTAGNDSFSFQLLVYHEGKHMTIN